MQTASRQLQPQQHQNGLWQRPRGGSDSCESGSHSWSKNCRAPQRLHMQVCRRGQHVRQHLCCLLADLQHGCINQDVSCARFSVVYVQRRRRWQRRRLHSRRSAHVRMMQSVNSSIRCPLGHARVHSLRRQWLLARCAMT